MIKYYLRRLYQISFSVLLQKVAIALNKKIQRPYFYTLYLLQSYKLSFTRKKQFSDLEELGKDLKDNLLLSIQTDKKYLKNSISRSKDFLDSKEFQCLGYGKLRIPQSDEWHFDLFHNFKWKSIYFNKINFVQTKRFCDVKIPWEMSRMQYLLYLAEGYLLDKKNDEGYKSLFLAILNDWYESNPIGYGVNWTVAMEVSIRGINIALASSIFWDDLTKKDKSRIYFLLKNHLRYLKQFPEISDYSGNHYLAGLMGELTLSFIIGKEENHLKRIYKKACKEIACQFEKEGSHYERSPIYHRLCLDMLSIIIAFSNRAGFETENLNNIFSKGVEFCKLLSNGEDLLPVIGDCDSGHIIWFGESHRSFEYLLFLNQERFKHSSDQHRLIGKALWIDSIIKKPNNTRSFSSKRLHKNSSYASGFLVGESSDIKCIMRGGELGLNGRASHDHDDSLSLWAWYKQKEFLSEKGCYSYTLDPKKRSLDISSLGHNVIQPLDDQRSVLGQGSIVKTAYGCLKADNWTHNSSEYSVTIQGSIRNESLKENNLIDHNREVLILNKDAPKIVCNDNIAWKKKSASLVRWHFGEHFKVDSHSQEGRVFLKNGSQIICELIVITDERFFIKPFQYEYSFSYGEVKTAEGVDIVLHDGLRHSIQTRFDFID